MNWRVEIRGLASGLALVAVGLLIAISRDFGLPGQALLQSLRFHIAIAALVLPLLLLLGGAPWRALLMTALVAASLGQGGWLLSQQFSRRAPLAQMPVAGSLDLFSFNVLSGNTRGREIADFMLAETPDVMITMESSVLWPYLDDLSSVYTQRAGCNAESSCDTTIWSRLPLIEARVHRFGLFQRERLVVVRVAVGGQEVTVVAVHLTKPYFDEMADLELEILAAGVGRLEGPLVLAGDFNAALWSNALLRLADALDLAPGPALPGTWPVRAGDLGVPIDNVFTRGNALITDLAAIPDALGSNHRGLRARIDILQPTAPSP